MTPNPTMFEALAETEWSPLFVSLKIAGCATGLALIAGIAAAWFVVRRGTHGRALWDGVFSLPLVLPPTVVGFLLLVLFGRRGPIGKVFGLFDIRIIFTWQAAVIAGTVVAFPLVYRVVRASFEQIDPVVLHAGRTLGLSETTIFFRLMMPMALPGCIGGAVLGFARALGEFGATLMIAGNIPGQTRTIPIAIWSAAESNDMASAGLWVGVIMLLSFLVILPLNFWGARHHA